MHPKVLIIIPAYNESSNIVGVIEALYNESDKYDLLVIDDGSSDDTSILAKDTNKCEVIRLYENLGIGGAVQTGYKYAKKYNYDIAIQFDGDGQHNAHEIVHLIQKIDEGYDMVIGSRFIYEGENFKSSKFRRVGIKLFEIVNSILINQKITDNTSGFRAFNRNLINLFAADYPDDYPEPEAVIIASKNNFKIIEVPVKMNVRQGGSSSIYGFDYIYYFCKVFLSILLSSLRKKGNYA